MTYGIALAQGGNAASGEAITRAARLAKELGFEHVWVGDYVVHPKGQPFPPSPLVVDAFVARTWAAAATQRIGLGRCALVLPRHNLFGAVDGRSDGQAVNERLTVGRPDQHRRWPRVRGASSDTPAGGICNPSRRLGRGLRGR